MSSTKGKANQRFFQYNYGHSILLKPFFFKFLRFWFPVKWNFLSWHSVTKENMSLAYLILLHTVHGVLILFMGLKAGREGDDRGWDGWIASPTWRTWIWVSSRSWWWTGKPGVLQSMGSQRVGHNWATELNISTWASLMAQIIKTLTIIWETWIQSLHWEDPPREGSGSPL